MLANPHGGYELCDDHPETCPSTYEGTTECRWWLGPVAISEDDTRVAYHLGDGVATSELIVRDAATYEELRRISLSGTGWGFAEDLELTAIGWVLLTRRQCDMTACSSSAIAVGPDDTVYGPFDLPTAAIWSPAPAISSPPVPELGG